MMVMGIEFRTMSGQKFEFRDALIHTGLYTIAVMTFFGQIISMRHSLPVTPQFYVTAPQPCPYLEGKLERKLFAALHGDSAHDLNDVLSHQGFRRSQNVVYRPSCADCALCLSARIRVADFEPSRSQRRIARKNEHMIREGSTPWATESQFELFKEYLASRHFDGGMADMDIFEFASMVEETPVRSRVVEYRTLGTEDDPAPSLSAVCLRTALRLLGILGARLSEDGL